MSESSAWAYERAFVRNLGLVSPDEQQKLRATRVAIVGQGGVGGIHLVTLARLGIGKFTIADPDTFEVANFNRQYGATVSTIGQSKVKVMEKILHDINPEAELRMIESVTADNAAQFLDGADIFIDGIDAFEIDMRRLLFHEAARRGIYAVTAGPIGFSTAWLTFDPKGMSFDRYFDLSDGMDKAQKFAAFLAGLVPVATHRGYMDISYVNMKQHVGPSASLACQLSAGVAAAEAIKIILNRGPIESAPHFHQFDAYRQRYVHGKLRFGNRSWWQRFKRRLLEKYLRKTLS